MEVRTLCRECNKYYCYFDDNDELLADGCKLDLPIFKRNEPIVCSSYNDRK